jgi:peptidoglycan hydrolase-like protein with peptidoglycan-binding domain
VQDALAREGYYHGPVDGYLNAATQDAIARYEADYHLPVTSAIDQSLLNSLGLD